MNATERSSAAPANSPQTRFPRVSVIGSELLVSVPLWLTLWMVVCRCPAGAQGELALRRRLASLPLARPEGQYDLVIHGEGASVRVAGEEVGSLRQHDGHVVFFSTSWLPERIDWRAAVAHPLSQEHFRNAALTAAAATWPDFRRDLTSVRRVTVACEPHDPPTVQVELIATPHPRLRLSARLRFLAWTGGISEMRREPDVVVSPPVSPRITEEQALALAREAVRQSAPDGPDTWQHVELWFVSGRLCWGIDLGWGRNADVQGLPQTMAHVDVATDTPQVVRTLPSADTSRVAAIVGRGTPSQTAEAASPAFGSADSAPALDPDGRLTFVSTRPRRSFPWWQWEHASCLLGSDVAPKWYTSDFRRSYARCARVAHHLLALCQDELEVVDLRTGRVEVLTGVAAFAMDPSTLALYVVRSEGPAARPLLFEYRVHDVRLPRRSVQLTHLSGTVSCLALSPDGRHLALVEQRLKAGSPARLWLVALADPSTRHVLAEVAPVSTLTWSPEGNRLLADMANRETPTIVSVADGTTLRLELPDVVTALEPADWAWGPETTSYVFSGLSTGEAPDQRARVIYRWNKSSGRVVPMTSANPSPVLPYEFGDGTSAVEIASRSEQRRWEELRQELAGRRVLQNVPGSLFVRP